MADSPDRDFVTELTNRYDHGAAVYRELWAPILREAAQPLVRELSGEHVERVLDVGAGVGILLPDLSQAFPGAFVTGVDRSGGMLALAPAAFGRTLMDATALGIRGASVDRVFLIFMLFHLEDPGAGLREARRVLRPGGRVGTLTWGREIQSRAAEIWGECLDAHGAIPPDPSADARHEVVDAAAKMESLLRAAGFETPRAWEDDLVTRIEADHLIRLRTHLGYSKPRFDSLSAGAAAACVTEARRRMSDLGADGFVARARLVYAVARA
jgi:ubiquinone/menaquinone biosynthesis C-methylase UbiE